MPNNDAIAVLQRRLAGVEMTHTDCRGKGWTLHLQWNAAEEVYEKTELAVGCSGCGGSGGEANLVKGIGTVLPFAALAPLCVGCEDCLGKALTTPVPFSSSDLCHGTRKRPITTDVEKLVFAGIWTLWPEAVLIFQAKAVQLRPRYGYPQVYTAKTLLLATLEACKAMNMKVLE